MNNAWQKYLPFDPVPLTGRKWPDARLTRAPTWCSVDLRDGNQALVEPMNLSEKLSYFQMLVSLGFQEIEIGFPSASQVEFDFARTLIDERLIPDDVTVQVLTPARAHLIERTFEAVEGANRVMMHLYVNTSPFFRQVVFNTDKAGVIRLVEKGARAILAQAQGRSGIRYEFSPEAFSATEPDFAAAVCARALDAFEATHERPVVLNLPATVERSMPCGFADQVEYLIGHLPDAGRAIISVHPHNDRGTGVAAAELAMLAGATRVEGTLFGNGERTGNVDLMTLALNCYTQGIDPGLDVQKIGEAARVYERATRQRIHERWPYVGELVFTAFSGSHQDAIKKGFDYLREHDAATWQMPYLPIDPKDLGRDYEPIIRINAQSGKGGAAYVLEAHYGYKLPREMHADFGRVVQREADRLGTELAPEQLLRLFVREYCEADRPYKLLRHKITETGRDGRSAVQFEGAISYRSRVYALSGCGNGPIDAFFSAMREAHIEGFSFVSYHEHAISSGSDAKAVAYIELTYAGESAFGVGIESNVTIASIQGIICAINRALTKAESEANTP